MVFGINGFQYRTPLVIPPLIELAGHRPLQAFVLGSQNGVPGDQPPQPVLQAYPILNGSRYQAVGHHADETKS